jgi:hypothetical protein
LIWGISWIAFSMRSVTSSSTSCGLAPGYCVTTSAVLTEKSGSSSWPREEKAAAPPTPRMKIAK